MIPSSSHRAAVLLVSTLTLGTALAQTEWSNWDQAKAFEEARQRVRAGKDPMPGFRTCFWRYGPSSGDPYLNIAFPDAGTMYWGAVFTMPQGAKLRLEGRFPHSRYMSLISYNFKGAPIESIADYLIAPAAGSVNPFRDGANRRSEQRSYSLEVVNAPLEKPMRWGVYLKGESRDRIHVPQQADNPQQQLQYRIYGRDRTTDETGNASLPEPILTLADGKTLRGAEACAQLRTAQPVVADLGAMALPREELQRLVAIAKERLGPNGPATNPPTWIKASEDTSRYAIYDGNLASEPDVRKRDGSFYANQDNQYLRGFLNRKFGEVWVMRANAPTTPHTWNGDATWNHDAQLRYWSWCSTQGFGTARVNACVFDEQLPLDAQGYYTIVVSRASDRPRNAMLECGVAWLPMADVGDGTGETDLTIITMRQMLGTGNFKEALHNIPSQNGIESGMGPYFPRGRYMTVSAFETARPCLVEKR